MAQANKDRIEKQIQLRAPRSRVWRALSDAQEFGSWLAARWTAGSNPAPRVSGNVTHPGYEHLTFEIFVERMEPERVFSWRWHPAPVDAGVDYTKEPTTLVVFELEDAPGGTMLKVVESGFDQIPLERRAKA